MGATGQSLSPKSFTKHVSCYVQQQFTIILPHRKYQQVASLTTDDNFEFDTKDFAKPTAEASSSSTGNYTTQRQHASQSYLEKQ